MQIRMDDVDWNQVRAFLATVDAGSLSAAARGLGLTQPTLSRQVGALETSLNVTLFERIGKRLVLTEAGASLAEHARTMGDAAAAITLAASRQSRTVAGRVAISASEPYAAYILPHVIDRIRPEAPEINLVIVSSNGLNDLRRREADIAIRNKRPDEDGLIGKLVREQTAGFYASRSWLARHGRPQAPSDLSSRDILAYEEGGRFAEALHEVGVRLESDGFGLVTESSVSVWEMVKLGLGVAVMSRDIAALTPDVVDLFPDMEGFRFPIWLVAHRELKTSPRVRVIYDLLCRELGRARR